MNLNGKQFLAIGVALLGVLGASTAQLDIIVGPAITKVVVAIDTLLMSGMSAVLAVLTGQSNIVKDVQAMPGVEKITINAQANPTLATLAVDPKNDKIEPTPQAATAVAKTAREAA